MVECNATIGLDQVPLGTKWDRFLMASDFPSKAMQVLRQYHLE
jgi:hypothetical protein